MAVKTDQSGSVHIIQIQEKFIDAMNSSQIKAEIQEQFKESKHVVLDLSLVEFLDSSGMGAILTSMRQLNNLGGQLKLSGVSRSVRTLFELVRFHKILEIYDSTQEAVAAFSQSS